MKTSSFLLFGAGWTLLLSGFAYPQPLQLPPEASLSIAQFMEHALEGRLEELKAGLGAGISPDQTDENGRTPLMLSAFNGHPEATSFLLKQGADVNARDRIDRTPLMYASTGPHPNIVEMLLQHGAEVNAVDSHEHFTALMFAAAEGHRTVVEFLLKHGADPGMKDTDGDTAANFALQRGYQALAKDLQSAEAHAGNDSATPP